MAHWRRRWHPELKLCQWRSKAQAGVRRRVVVRDQRIQQFFRVLQLEGRLFGDGDGIRATLVRWSTTCRRCQPMETTRSKVAEERLDERAVIFATAARVASTST